MVELGQQLPHAHHPPVKKVIDGENNGGITEAVAWKCGGFCYCRLAPSLLAEDSFGKLIINKQYNVTMLIEAIYKMMGFTYWSGEFSWQQGHSTESGTWS